MKIKEDIHFLIPHRSKGEVINRYDARPEDLRPFQGECNISDARFRTKLGNVLAKYFHNDHLEYWDTEPLKVIEKKFAAAMNHFDALPLGFTALKGVNYIESKVYNVVSRQDACSALPVTVAGMQCISSPSGPIKFFRSIAGIKRRFDILNGVKYPWESIFDFDDNYENDENSSSNSSNTDEHEYEYEHEHK
ncbi:hypothetical protein FRACYDRAFT_233565 [Fragilariopsis cylindrus CCMP1102]|uniref:Uncharacterized protein n=1 Tax=Fragilariopsis cylindrus CCMP1102 TaxID=635003 RepID=A0A1E7FZ06_9STRA|nr:hypothetical protein FRACYDRAFT_233565 [Fragilariopsis cylindrus CCMP1102]|eukprot:OEU23392.1 hypothetical protein FRACYDRAFT_233565 [Fragilariopsis cylindrus CCMP1102]